jgi:dual specificity phosphatase 12
MCGATLFTDTEVLEHDAGTGQASFDWRKRNNSKYVKKKCGSMCCIFMSYNSQVGCTSYFLNEPTQFGDTTELEGKLTCPKCCSKFGSWVWAGAQCSCGYEYRLSALNIIDNI